MPRGAESEQLSSSACRRQATSHWDILSRCSYEPSSGKRGFTARRTHDLPKARVGLRADHRVDVRHDGLADAGLHVPAGRAEALGEEQHLVDRRHAPRPLDHVAPCRQLWEQVGAGQVRKAGSNGTLLDGASLVNNAGRPRRAPLATAATDEREWLIFFSLYSSCSLLAPSAPAASGVSRAGASSRSWSACVRIFKG